MEKYKRFYGIIIFIAAAVFSVYCGYHIIVPKITAIQSKDKTIETKEKELQSKQQQLKIVQNKIKRIQDSITGSQKKIYSPMESDLGNDTLFFTLYNDMIEMVHANSIKIKSINYEHNPETDAFVEFGKDVYFVCDLDMELISNYVNLGKLIEDIYQYPYYIKINNIDIKPYPKDKKILITKMSLRLYAHTSPDDKQ